VVGGEAAAAGPWVRQGGSRSLRGGGRHDLDAVGPWLRPGD
jgi:hypothetical protein